MLVSEQVSERSPGRSPGLGPVSGPAPVRRRGSPLVVAHRGASATAPENTLAAFESALWAGADLLELDVQLTADGVPVVLHDATLDRTTDGTGAVADTPWHRLERLDAGGWFSPAFAGQRVPSLGRVAQLLARHPGRGLLVEFKGDWTAEQAGVAVAVLRRTGVAQRCVLQSFSLATVRALALAAPDLPRAVLVLRPGEPLPLASFLAALDDPERDLQAALGTDPAEVAAAARELAASTGAVACNPHAAAVVACPEVPALHRAAGLGTWVWTVNEPALWRVLVRAGVDGIITDDPGRLRGWLDAREERSTQDLPPDERADLLRLAVARRRRTRDPVPA
ncbi:glycerophosphodiester phosphodiesterase [Kineococcus terrestris]|uniref:glycerophosphodiester phosphodiesterase n=1 Tax=Kineococcus terrestris TaxID=2044856 RepID=UPI0034DB4BC1